MTGDEFSIGSISNAQTMLNLADLRAGQIAVSFKISLASASTQTEHRHPHSRPCVQRSGVGLLLNL
jgi:hypothetical protein